MKILVTFTNFYMEYNHFNKLLKISIMKRDKYTSRRDTRDTYYTT